MNWFIKITHIDLQNRKEVELTINPNAICAMFPTTAQLPAGDVVDGTGEPATKDIPATTIVLANGNALLAKETIADIDEMISFMHGVEPVAGVA